MKPRTFWHQILPFLTLLLFAGFIWILKQELGRYEFSDTLQSLLTIPKLKINLAILLTILGYLAVSFYDVIAFQYLKYPLKINKILNTAFLSYAIGNSTGFAVFVGGGIRYRFYDRYRIPTKIIAQIIALSNLSFWLGLLAVGGITFICDPLAVPELIHLHFFTVRPIGISFLILTAIYLYLSWQQHSIKIKGNIFAVPPLSISIAQIIISVLDWAIASAALYVLLPNHTHISYFAFFGIYLLGTTCATISHIPGGLGVFESVILYLLPQQVAANDSLGALLAYRAIYFLLPLFVALIWLVIYEIKKKLIIE
jgi:hypothetical protein